MNGIKFRIEIFNNTNLGAIIRMLSAIIQILSAINRIALIELINNWPSF